MSTTTFTMPKTAAEANRMGVSICIPRIFNNINYRRIKNWFIQNLRSWGFVERVDVVPVFKDGKQVHKRAFVHYAIGKFNLNADDGSGNKIIDALIGGDTIQVIYDEPWYWKLSLSRSARPDEPPKPRQGPALKIELKRSAVSTTSEEKTPEADIANAPTLSVHDELDDSEEDKETVVSYERGGAAELAMFGEEAFDNAN
jgi:hypothetical protein